MQRLLGILKQQQVVEIDICVFTTTIIFVNLYNNKFLMN